MIKAGVKDMSHCVDVMEDMLLTLNRGDYVMGGMNHNSHGTQIIFPDHPAFRGMPQNADDRRFMAMPAYLGGRYQMAGMKWYGSNVENKTKGLPRSILMMMLNDKDTGEPLAFMSANLLSAARTGAVPGVAARHLARKDSKVCAVLGCGPINKSCFRSIASQLPSLEKVFCFDLFEEKSKDFAAWAEKETGIKGEGVTDLELALKNADVVTVAASRLKPLILKDEWIKKGCTVLISGPVQFDDSYWTSTKLIYDNVRLHEAYVQEAVESGDKKAGYAAVIGGPIYTLIDDGKLPALKDSTSIGDVILKTRPGRESDDERVTFVACGMATFDVGLGYDLWKTALDKGIGTKLLLWDEPYQMKE